MSSPQMWYIFCEETKLFPVSCCCLYPFPAPSAVASPCCIDTKLEPALPFLLPVFVLQIVMINHLGDPFCVQQGCTFASFLSASLFSLMIIKPSFWRHVLGMINHDAGWDEWRPPFSLILSGFYFLYIFLRNWSLDSLIDWKNNWEKDPTTFPPSRDTQAISLETYVVKKFALLSLVPLFCDNRCKGRIQREPTSAFTCDSLGVKRDCCQVTQRSPGGWTTHAAHAGE